MSNLPNARIRLGLVFAPVWALTACGGGTPAATVGASAPSSSTTPTAGGPTTPGSAVPATPVPLPTATSAPQDSTPATTHADAPLRVAVHSNGDALLVWAQTPSGGTREVHALRYQYASNTWDASSTLVTTPGANGVFGPRVAMDASGNAMVVWTQSNGCFARRYNVGTGWVAAPEQLSTSADDVVLAGNRGDVALAVWHNGAGLHSREYSFASGVWGGASTITGSGNHPSLGMDGQGRAVLAWFRNSGAFTVVASRHLPGSGWTAETTLDAGYVADYPQVAVSGTGNAIVAWEGSTPVTGRNQVWSTQYSITGGTWSGAQLINTLNTTDNASDIAVRMDSDGKGMAMWHEGGVVHAARYSAGAWAASGQVDADGYTPAFILNDLNQAAAIWQRWSSDEIHGRTQTDPALAWSAATKLQVGTGGTGSPVTEASASGHVIVQAWLQRVSGNFHVMRTVVR